MNYLCISYVLFVDIFTRLFDDFISMKFLIALFLLASPFINFGDFCQPLCLLQPPCLLFWLKFAGSPSVWSSRVLVNSTTNLSRFHVIIKQYWHFQRVSGKQYYTPFESSYQTNTDIFRELLANNTAHLSRASIKQYRKKLQTLKISNQYQTILTFSESYWQAILHTFQEVIASNIHIFRVHITQYCHV